METSESNGDGVVASPDKIIEMEEYQEEDEEDQKG